MKAKKTKKSKKNDDIKIYIADPELAAALEPLLREVCAKHGVTLTKARIKGKAAEKLIKKLGLSKPEPKPRGRKCEACGGDRRGALPGRRLGGLRERPLHGMRRDGARRRHTGGAQG